MKSELLTKWKGREIGSLMAQVRRYTQFVFFGKILLVFLALCLVALLIIIPFVKSDSSGTRIAFSAIEEGDNASPVMTNPKYQGLDKDNNPFTVIAKTAMHESKNRVGLNQIQAELTTQDNKWLAISADSGTLEIEKRQVQLVGNVHAFYGEGYELRTEWASIDMAASEAFGDMGVVAQGPVGTLVAKGFHTFDKGERIVFIGPVKMTIYPAEAKR